jgi:leader peptidase (prepilin peptidase)/N-methyltransferase
LAEVALFILGTILGSFFNVVIYRVPRGESIIRPASACPACGTRLRAWDNIPLLSYIVLGGRCRYCSKPISARYPTVELLSGVLPVLFFLSFGWSPAFFVYWGVSCVLVIVSFIDLDHLIIPDGFTIPGIAVGLVVAPMAGLIGFWEAVIGALVGGAALLIIGFLGELVFKKESMGMGDVKLAAMLGVFMGWRMLILSLFVAFFIGSVVGIVCLANKSKGWDSHLPFGPFIALGAVIALLWGEPILLWYMSLLVV